MSRSKAASRRSTAPTGCLPHERRGDADVPEIAPAQIESQLSLAVDRVMAEGSLYDRDLAALAIKQARGDLIEAIFLVRAFRTTLPRLGLSEPIETNAMAIRRRVLGDLQGPAGRAAARADLRLHPSPDRFRARRGGDAPSPGRGAGRSRDGDAAGDRPPRRGRADRAGKRRPRRRRRRPDPGAARLPRRPRPPPAGAGARRRRIPPRPRLLDPARLRPHPSLRRRDPHRRGRGRDGARRARLCGAARPDHS